ncbi:MBOAT, membrane-bound O-acyltransferase family-domain-containing protein [Myxozyma melibiosi]|uniref:MBOAT, membrane-bound O-acyltransferase family-domain-containing protein n=1 Tax=Myxozyma melibiosi TaxID=54550 RepID=A0ABR1FA46_9ASCO
MIGIIDDAMGAAAKQIGLDTDPLKLFLTFVLSYPLCAVLKRLPDYTPVYKQLFCIAVSAFYLLGIFDLKDGVQTLMISAMGTYGLAKYVKSPLMPWMVFVFVMGHLTINHIERYRSPEDTSSSGRMDITGSQMVLVMKLSAFGWNVHDGRRPASELSSLQKDRALPTLPPLLDYLTYVFFFPSLMVGPSFDYSEFRRWLDFSIFENEYTTPHPDGKPRKHKRKIPRSGRVAARKAAEGVMWIALWIIMSSKFSSGVLFTDTYLGRNFFYRAFYMWPLGFAYRLKYYGAWTLAEGACILSGLSYNGIDPVTKKRKWDRVRNIDPYRHETGQNMHALLETWNMNTNKWLKTYVYLRVTPKGKRPGFRSTLFTFATSAFWHGVSPGYYLTFITGAFLQSCGRSARRYIRPFFMSPDLSQPGPYKKYYDALTYVVSQMSLQYTVQPFVILTFRDSLYVWSTVYFYVHIGIFIFITTFSQKKVKKYIEAKLAARTEISSKLDKLRFEIEQARIKKIPVEVERVLAREPTLGVPDQELDEALELMRGEMTEDISALKQDLQEFRRRATNTFDDAKKSLPRPRSRKE